MYKKNAVPLIFCLLALSGCNESVSDSTSIQPSETESVTSESELVSESISYIENPFVEEKLNEGYLEIRKTIYQSQGVIKVFPHNCGGNDWVGIYTKEYEPAETTSIVWEYVGNKECIEFKVSSLKGPGDYGVYLCEDGGYMVLDKKDIKVTDDTTNYCINDATYKINNNDGVNQLEVTIYPSSKKELTYSLYWAYEEEILDTYTPLKVIKSKDVDSFTVTLNECIYMPQEATGICVCVEDGVSFPYYIPLDDSLKLEKANYLYNFQVFSDLHIEDGFINHHSHLKTALKEVLQFAGNSEGIFVVGDATNRGTEANYVMLKSLIGQVFTEEKFVKMYYALGNHEYMYGTTYNDSLELFKKHTGMPSVNYSVEIQGCKFIILGSNEKQMEGSISDEQLDWLKQELKVVDKEKPTFLFMHQPLKDTTSGSLTGQNWDGMRSQAARLKALLKEYPNAFMFSGHTHWTLDSVQPVLYGKGVDASYLNTASVGYLWNDNDKDEPGSEGLFIEVYDKYVLVKGREFVDRKWVSATMMKLPITK